MLNKMHKIKRILEKMKNKYERKEQHNIKLRKWYNLIKKIQNQNFKKI